MPLVFNGRALGVFGAFDRLTDGPGFSIEDERLMDAFAASAATAVATAQNVARQGLRRSIEAAETERGRWARELHDDTLQELAALKIVLVSARRATDPATGGALDRAVVQIDATIADLRALITDLRPASLDALGARRRVAALVERDGADVVGIEFAVDLDFDAGRAEPSRGAIETGDLPARAGGAHECRRARGRATVRVGVSEAGRFVTGVVRDDGAGSIPTSRTPASA